MQNDFVKNEPFTCDRAKWIIPNIVKMIESGTYDEIYFTQDTHYTWQSSIEMKEVPPHCMASPSL
jgi:nicotinamidase-related amidase